MRRPSAVGAKFGRLITSCALFVGIKSAAPFCFIFFHQPKVPQGMSKYVKG